MTKPAGFLSCVKKACRAETDRHRHSHFGEVKGQPQEEEEEGE